MFLPKGQDTQIVFFEYVNPDTHKAARSTFTPLSLLGNKLDVKSATDEKIQRMAKAEKREIARRVIPTHVVYFSNFVPLEELEDEEAYNEIYEDIETELQEFGEIVEFLLPKPIPAEVFIQEIAEELAEEERLKEKFAQDEIDKAVEEGLKESGGDDNADNNSSSPKEKKAPQELGEDQVVMMIDEEEDEKEAEEAKKKKEAEEKKKGAETTAIALVGGTEKSAAASALALLTENQLDAKTRLRRQAKHSELGVGFGFVQFKTVSQASAAQRNFNGRMFGDMKIKCDFLSERLWRTREFFDKTTFQFNIKPNTEEREMEDEVSEDESGKPKALEGVKQLALGSVPANAAEAAGGAVVRWTPGMMSDEEGDEEKNKNDPTSQNRNQMILDNVNPMVSNEVGQPKVTDWRTPHQKAMAAIQEQMKSHRTTVEKEKEDRLKKVEEEKKRKEEEAKNPKPAENADVEMKDANGTENKSGQPMPKIPAKPKRKAKVESAKK